MTSLSVIRHFRLGRLVDLYRLVEFEIKIFHNYWIGTEVFNTFTTRKLTISTT